MSIVVLSKDNADDGPVNIADILEDIAGKLRSSDVDATAGFIQTDGTAVSMPPSANENILIVIAAKMGEGPGYPDPVQPLTVAQVGDATQAAMESL